MNKKCFIVVLAIQLHLMGMEPVPSITPSIESEFLELLQRFDATDAVCREKKFALLNEQAFLLQELQKKLHHQSLQTLGNYALFNAYFLKKISNTVLLLIETKKLSDTNPSDHIFYQNLPDSLLQARKWILEGEDAERGYRAIKKKFKAQKRIAEQINKDRESKTEELNEEDDHGSFFSKIQQLLVRVPGLKGLIKRK
jgi:hypothetical protein